MPDDGNGHYLDKYGCAFGQVSSQQIVSLRIDVVELKANIKGINYKLWTLILLLLVQMAGTIVYLITRA